MYVLDVAEEEHEVLRLARGQCNLDVMRGDGAPAVGVAVTRLALHHSLRIGELVVEAYERLAIGIEALNIRIHMIESVVVTALAILGLVVNR